MNTEEINKKLREIADPIDELRSQREELMNEIKPRLDSLDAQIQLLEEDRSGQLVELFATLTLEDLSDPQRLTVFSEIGWNHGRGIPKTSAVFKKIFADTYIIPETNWVGPYDTPVMSFTVSVPAQRDQEKLRRTAEILEPILKAQTAISETIGIGILEDSLAGMYHITWESEEHVYVLNRYSQTSDDLLTLLENVPTYY